MDRRQIKTREAIFKAFIALLTKENYNKITVGDIIEKANVGRATFYSHFETKDYLLKELCEDLFCHVFDCVCDCDKKHKHLFDCDAPNSVFLHLFQHFSKNDNNILKLLASENNELFLYYFKKDLVELVKSQLVFFANNAPKNIPESYFINHVASTFVETIKWWIEGGMKETAEEITDYFLAVIK